MGELSVIMTGPSTYTYDEEQAKINTLVGNTGEEMVASYEKNLLIQSGNSELADRVEIVAKTMGDGMGYDVLSFDQSGKEKFIEVKATRSNGVNANFTFTSNELDFLATYPNSAFVYCVFAISSDNPRLKIYPAKQFLDGVFEPMEYRVSVF